MGTVYVDTGGATTNSGTTDTNGSTVNGTSATSSTTTITLLTDNPSLAFLSGRTSGATQAAIYLNNATNANRKIFWITAFDDTLKTVTVDTAPTGVGASVTSWAIDGRYTTPANSGLSVIESAFRAGDVIQYNNSPSSSTASQITIRAGGSEAAGFIKYVGKTGVRPVLACSSTNATIAGSGSSQFEWFENFQLDKSGGSGNCFDRFGSGDVMYNVKVASSNAQGLRDSGAVGNWRVIACEITNCTTDGIAAFAGAIVLDNYIHNLTGNGMDNGIGNSPCAIVGNVFAACGGRGLLFSGSPSQYSNICLVYQNTIYGCTKSGLEVADASTPMTMMNNVLSVNGNASGEYNLEWVAGTMEFTSFHRYNDFYTAGAGGSANLQNVTAQTTEITTDPAFTNPGSGDFSIPSTSGAYKTGYPGQFIGGNLGYMSMGAVQPNPSSVASPVGQQVGMS